MADAPASPPPEDAPTPSTPGKKPRKKKLVRDRKTYDSLVAAYREAPGNHSHVCRRTGAARVVCKRVWELGWPDLAGARPIREVIADERDAARTVALERARKDAELADAEREKNRAAMRTAMVEEATLQNETRSGTLTLSKVVNRLAPAMAAVARVVSNAVIDPNTGQVLPNPALNPIQAMKLLREFTMVVNRLAYAQSVVVELGRLDRGQSTLNLNVSTDVDDAALLEDLELVANVREQLAASAAARGTGEEDEPLLQ